MVGKTPPHITAIRPLVRGVISDFEVTEKMLRYFIEQVHRDRIGAFARPRVVIGVPLNITEVERKAVEDAVKSAGASQVYLVEEAMAAALGSRLPVQEPVGNMIVDIGGGTTEIAVISLSGVVTWRSVPNAGVEMDRAIITFARERHNLLIGDGVAEEVKMGVGSAVKLSEPLEMKMRGRDLLTGLPREVTVSDDEIRAALSRPVRAIIDHIIAALEMTPPELVADIYERGMVLAGGGSLLKGIDDAIRHATEIPVRIADDPMTCVVRGTGAIIEELEELRHVFLPSTDMDIAGIRAA
jgi:rod shape-determining protein MreB